MSLSKLNLPSHSVTVGGEEIVLRGLSFYAITGIIKGHRDSLDKLFAMGKSTIESGEDVLISDIAFDLLSESPDLVAAIIAHACGEPKAIDQAKSLPFTTQLEMIDHITELTFKEFGGAGKLFKLVTKMMSKLSTVTDTMTA